MACADHFFGVVVALLHIIVDDGGDVGVKLEFSCGLRSGSIVPKGALELYSPFVVPATAIMPPVVGPGEAILLRAEIRDALLDHLVGGVFECSLEGEADSECASTGLGARYLWGRECGWSRREDMKGSCEGSFWLKLSLYREMFLRGESITC